MFVKVASLALVVIGGCAVPTRTATSPGGQAYNMCDYGETFLDEAHQKAMEGSDASLTSKYVTWSFWYSTNACPGGGKSYPIASTESPAEQAQHIDSICTGMEGMLKAFAPHQLNRYGQLKSAYDNNCPQEATEKSAKLN